MTQEEIDNLTRIIAEKTGTDEGETMDELKSSANRVAIPVEVSKKIQILYQKADELEKLEKETGLTSGIRVIRRK